MRLFFFAENLRFVLQCGMMKRNEKQKKKLAEILSQNSHQSIEKIIQDCERDYYLDPKDAIEYGLIDEII
mgnify:CR=1 FL=1